MNYPVLALDAAVGRSYACLLLSEEEVLSAESAGSRAHSQSLMPMLEALLSRAEITWGALNMLALGVGPGSFTGLRIAAAALAGINASLQLPLISISSLAITSVQADSKETIYVLEDARAGELFIGRYHGAVSMQDDQCISWDALDDMQPSDYISIAALPSDPCRWQRFEPSLQRSEAMAIVVREVMGREKLSNLPKYVQPAYLQISQAERNCQAKRL